MSRCTVCWLPSHLPVCSQRCRKLAPVKRQILAKRLEWEEAVVSAVQALGDKATECPGNLSERTLRERGIELEARDALACLRELYFALRSARKIRFYQKGVVIPAGKDDFRGPFRLGK